MALISPVLMIVAALAGADNPFAAETAPDAARYRACIAQASANPDAARRAADLWRMNEGGAPAKHCLAAALAALGRTREAAQWVEEAAEDVIVGESHKALGRVVTPELIADLKATAAQYWFDAGDYDRAVIRLTEAIGLVPVSSRRIDGYLVLRARAVAGLGRYDDARRDLTDAITRAPDQAYLYVLRATAERYLEHYDEAEIDLAKALALMPDDKDALLERGIVRRVTGDNAAAKADWQRIVDLYPQSDTAEVALDNLELLRGED